MSLQVQPGGNEEGVSLWPTIARVNNKAVVNGDDTKCCR